MTKDRVILLSYKDDFYYMILSFIDDKVKFIFTIYFKEFLK